MRITFRQGGDNTLKCVNQLLDKMTLDVFNSLLKKEYVKPETDVYETLVSPLMGASLIHPEGEPGGGGSEPGGHGGFDAKTFFFGDFEDPEEVEAETPQEVVEDIEEPDSVVWGLNWPRLW